MDDNSTLALLIGLVLTIIAGTIFAVTGVRRLTVSLPTGSMWPAMTGITRSAGGWIPYLFLLGGPIADVAYGEFKYTLLSMISIAAMMVGFVYQVVLHGPGNVLPVLTVGTTAAIVYLIQDAWVENIDGAKKIGTTVGGILGILITAIVVSGASLFQSSIANDFVAMLMGAGLGELAWVVVYNVDRSRLPFA